MLPVLGRKVVEGEQRLAILDQAFDCFVVFDAPSFDEGVERREGIGVFRWRVRSMFIPCDPRFRLSHERITRQLDILSTLRPALMALGVRGSWATWPAAAMDPGENRTIPRSDRRHSVPRRIQPSR
jgi:hypothetical protein